jgi:hypothetical protein
MAGKNAWRSARLRRAKRAVGLPRKGLVAIPPGLLLAHAAWIEAESPQKAHRRFRGLGADSPVFRFFAEGKKTEKCARNLFCELI